MSRPNEKPLTPNSLAADGIQGQGAKAVGPCGCDDTPTESDALFLLVQAICTARAAAKCYALVTDRPQPGTVEAADYLDAAADAIAQAVTP